jgi:DNA damage-inducible protein 1
MKLSIIPFIVALVGVLSCCSGALIEIMCDVNGFSIPAAVDTGSEITVMSTSCAKRCQILNNVDTRLASRVKGIGSTGEVIGAIKKQNFRIGPLQFNNKLEILRDSHRDLIIGLDVLQRFNGIVNLGKRLIRFDVQGSSIDVPLIQQLSAVSPVKAPPVTVQELSGGFYEQEDGEYGEYEESDGVDGEFEERVSMEGV